MNVTVKNKKLLINSTELFLPGYVVLDELGNGANAKVFLVYNMALDRKEALKIWVPRKNRSTVNEQQFFFELRKNSLFTGNSSIATVYTGGHQGDIYYCLMEYCPGITLNEFLENNPSWLYRWGLARQISDTMKTLYNKGIFHGDLHGKNIIININDNENWLKILDLGTSLFSGKDNSHKRDAQLLYDLSFQLLPCAHDLPFYNDQSISELPSPLLNQAFRAVVNISDPILTVPFDLQNRPSPDQYLPPDYHKLGIWQIASMVQNTPVFSLPLVEKFLDDFGYSKLTFYKELHDRLNLSGSTNDTDLIEATTKEYGKLFIEYRKNAAEPGYSFL